MSMSRTVLIGICLFVVIVLVAVAAIGSAAKPENVVPTAAPVPAATTPVALPEQPPSIVSGVKATRADLNSGNDGTLSLAGDVTAFYHPGDKLVVVDPDGKKHICSVVSAEAKANVKDPLGHTTLVVSPAYHHPELAPSWAILPAK